MRRRSGLPSNAGWLARSVQPRAGLRLEGLVDWLSRWKPPWRLLSAYLGFDAAGYRRIPLVRTADLELLLIAWLPGQSTEIHAHGGSVGAVRLLVGQLEERRYVPTPDGWRERARLLYRAPALLREGRSSVHRVEAVGPGPAVSLHLYSPPLPAAPGPDPDLDPDPAPA